MTNVILIGAPRSGTNMLRDVLASLDHIETWPCDEINYIWRHGNLFYPSDEIPETQATPEIINYIHRKFDNITKRQGGNIVLEKTCANCLRVPFVEKIFPSAQYIYIHRDGIDAAVSAQKRWTANLDIPYILKKVRFVPKVDLIYYGARYFSTRFYRIFSQQKRLSFWGPKLHDMDLILEKHSLIEVCLIQWQRCVLAAEKAFQAIPNNRVIRLSYEDFVNNPEQELKRILDFLNYTYTESMLQDAVKNVSSTNVGKGRASLEKSELKHLEELAANALEKYGYV